MNQAFLDYYRCPTRFADFRLMPGALTQRSASRSQIGVDLNRYRVAANGSGASPMESTLAGNSTAVADEASPYLLPFHLTDVVTNIRQERYVDKVDASFWKKLVKRAYYAVRPALPVHVRRHLQGAWLKGWDRKPFPSWPVDRTVDRILEQAMVLSVETAATRRIPFIWFWPEGKSSCAIMTHDVETDAGLNFCETLMDIDDSFGIKSSFQIIPEGRYKASNAMLDRMRSRGFEINVHDLRHDGHLFREAKQFPKRAEQINRYATAFGSKGFRSGVLYRNMEWYGAFKFAYDMSVPNVGHLDPQHGGCCTVMPFYVGNILELPVTTIQDYSLFNILGSYSIELWQQQIELIREQHGLMSFIVHPDYLDTAKARDTYQSLLAELARLRSEANVWIPTPGEVETWWRQRSQMQLVADGINWRIEGPGAEHASIAYATLVQDKLAYSVN
jgi:hypothetical protein